MLASKEIRKRDEERDEFAAQVLQDFVHGRKRVDISRAMNFASSEMRRRYPDGLALDTHVRRVIWLKLNHTGYWQMSFDRELVAC